MALTSPRRVQCVVLGPARITVDGGPAPPELLWRKHLALLVYLARSPRGTRTRDHLLGLLWADRDEKQARHSLSEALRVLRRALGDDAVAADVDQVRLEAGAVQLDCDEFARRRAGGDLAGAAALAQGEFLEGLSVPGANGFESWLAAERAQWRSQVVETLVAHAEARLAAGDARAAADAGRRALALDRTSEAAARAAMRALALEGDRAAALHVAEQLAHALAADVGAAPSPETARLVERVRDARVGRRPLAAPPAARPRPPLVARETELTALVTAWRRACAPGGRGQVVLVEGEPGEGKTRLVEELAARARLDDATVAWARAVPVDQAQNWSALAGLLTGGLAAAPGIVGAPAVALAALAALAPELPTPPAVTGVAPPPGAAFTTAVLAAAVERPVLLALDDAQWVDDATLATLPALARDTTRAPVLLALAVARGAPPATRLDELRAGIGRDLEGIVVRLGRLDPAGLVALAAWALPHYGRDELGRLARRVERDTAGIPALAVGLLEAVRDGFTLAPDQPAWPSPRRTLVDSLPGDLPPAVIGMICQRYRQLDTAAQRVLAAAAAHGARVESQPLARAAGLERDDVERALDLLEWERWLVADARGYVFAAPIVREILLQEMITPGQARRYRATWEA